MQLGKGMAMNIFTTGKWPVINKILVLLYFCFGTFGKTTALKIIASITKRTDNDLRWNGHNLQWDPVPSGAKTETPASMAIRNEIRQHTSWNCAKFPPRMGVHWVLFPLNHRKKGCFHHQQNWKLAEHSSHVATRVASATTWVGWTGSWPSRCCSLQFGSFWLSVWLCKSGTKSPFWYNVEISHDVWDM